MKYAGWYGSVATVRWQPAVVPQAATCVSACRWTFGSISENWKRYSRS
jgi:hypothetical protein